MSQNNSISVIVTASSATTYGADDKGLFHVAVTYGTQSWEVKHSLDEFKALSSALFVEMSDEAFPKLVDDASDADNLQNYLVSVIGNLNENLWYKEVIMAFLDEEPNKSFLTQVQLSKMSKQINYLLSKTAENEQKFLDIEAKSAKLDKIVEYLTNNMNTKPVSLPEPPKQTQQKVPTPLPTQQKLAPPGLPSSSGPPGLSSSTPTEKLNLTHAGAASFFNLPSSSAASPSDALRKGSSPPVVSDASLFQELEIGDSTLEESLENPPGIALGGGGAAGGSAAKSAVAAVFDEDDFDISLLDNARLGGANNLLLDDDLLRLSGDYQAKWDAAAKSAPAGTDGSALVAPKAIGHTTGPSSKYVARDSVSAQEEPLHYDKTINEILDALQPHEAQIQYRQSAVGLLKKQSRLALSSTTYEVGLHALHCFLPTDTIKLSVVISKNQVPYWHTSLGERLKLMEGGVVPADDAQYPDIYDDYKPMMNHAVRAVSFLNEKDVFKVVCAVDALEVEISANARTDICMLAFLEEVSEMVGLDNLFKRSLLLIRAWWVYETASYVGCPIKHYLSDFSLCIMVCAIFNQYHAQIGSPLQALCLFLTEYSGYDGSTHAITLQGIVSFQSVTSNQPQLVRPSAAHLVGPDMTAMYWEQFNIAAVTADVREAEAEAALAKTAALAAAAELASISGQFVGDLLSGAADGSPSPSSTPTGSTVSNVSINSNDYYNTLQSSIVLENRDEIVGDCIRGLATNNLFYFERVSFNVVHPFTNMNCIDKLSQRRMARLGKAFQIGATNLSLVLKRGSSVGGVSRAGSGEADHSTSNESLASPGGGRVTVLTCDDLFRGFFPAVLGRFSEKWRPDAINNSIVVAERYHADFPTRFVSPGAPPRDLYAVASSYQLWGMIFFTNLMVEAVLSESALQNLASEILATKGPLPVGEIGKILAELTSIGNLSQKLKEKFGGLKKFLEHFPTSFVIFNDHPFNPNVLLRRSLSAEQLDLIDRGIFPHQLLIKAKKGAVAAKKKSKSLSLPSPSVDILKQQQRQNQYNGHQLSSGMSAAAVQNAKYQQTLMRNGGGGGLQGMKGGGKPMTNGYLGGHQMHQPRAPLFQFHNQLQSSSQLAGSKFSVSSGASYGRPAIGLGGSKDLVELGFLSAGREFNEQQGALSNNSYFALAAAMNSPPPQNSNPFHLTRTDDLVLPGESNSAMLSSLRVNSVQLPRCQSSGDLVVSPAASSPLTLINGLGLGSHSASPPQQQSYIRNGNMQQPFGQHAYYASTNSLHTSSGGPSPNGLLLKHSLGGGNSRRNSDSSMGGAEGGAVTGFIPSQQNQLSQQNHSYHLQQQQSLTHQQQKQYQAQQYSTMDSFLHSNNGGQGHGGF